MSEIYQISNAGLTADKLKTPKTNSSQNKHMKVIKIMKKQQKKILI